jgi:PKD repeat protein
MRRKTSLTRRRKTTLQLEALEDRVLLDGRTDFLVNTTLTGNQLDPAVAVDGHGNYIVAWDGFNPANGTTDIFAQRFAADGTPNGGEFLVNSYTGGTQQFPKVAADNAGDFVIVWTGPKQDNGKVDLWGKRYNSSGTAVTGDVLLDPATEGLDSGVRVAMSADGSDVVVARTGKVSNVSDIYAERYDGNLNALGSAFRVDVVHTGSVSSSRLVMDASGNFVITWNTLASNGLLTVNGRRFDSAGNPLTTNDFAVSGTPVGGNQTNLALAMAPDGGFLAAWDAVDSTTHKLEVVAVRFNSAGQRGTPFVASDPTTSADFAAAGFDASGNSVIAWQTQGTGSPVPDNVFAQRYDSAGNRSGPVSQLNVTTASDLSTVMLAEAAGGTYLAVWPSLNSDKSTDVRGTLVVVAQPPALTSLTGTTSGNEGDTFQYHAAATDPNGDALTYSWDLNGDGVFGDAAGPDVQATFTAAGQHQVSVKVTDAHNLSTVGSLTVNVVNVAPTADAGPAQTVNEGDTVSFHGSSTDPGSPSETYAYLWDFNYDGQTFTPQATGASATHLYDQPGTYQVALEVLDSNGGVGVGVTTVTVMNVAPTADAGPAQTVNEGDTVSFQGSSTDPGSASESYVYVWDFNYDGQTFTTQATGASVTHLYDQPGTYQVALEVVDSNGGVGVSVTTVTVVNVAPTPNAGPAQTVGEGDTVSFQGSSVDPGSASESYAYFWDFNYDGQNFTFQASGASAQHVYDHPGTYQVALEVVDSNGGVGVGVTTVTVLADTPTVSAGPDQTVVEGTSVTLNSSITDPDFSLDSFTYSWVVTRDGAVFAQGSDQDFSFTPDDSGTYLATFTATEADGSSASSSATITVTDAALAAQPVAVSAVEGADTGSVTVATFTDTGIPEAPGAYTALVDWGDGTTSAGTITFAAGTFTVSGGHTYAEEGSFPVTVTVSEDGGSSAVVTGSATVQDAPLSAQGATLTSVEGQDTGSVTVATFTDADPGAAAGNFSAVIAWGDGTTSAGTIAADGHSGFVVSGSHTYAEEGSFPVSVAISDAGGAAATAGGTAAVADAPLAASGLNVGATEGASFSGAVASFTDANPGAVAGDFSAVIAWGDGTTSSGTVTANGSGGFVVSGSHTYAEEGSYPVSVTISDAGGSSATATVSAAVADAALSGSSRSITGTEGASFSGVVASFTDADPGAAAGNFSAVIAWGDGTTSAGTVAPDGHGGFTVSGSHAYADDGSYPVSVAITDAGGATLTAGGTAAVADAPLTASGLSVGATEGASFTGPVASFSDANPGAAAADFSAVIAWDDGTTSAGTIAADGHGGFTVSGSHAYAEEGSYAVGVSITDAGGSTATAAVTAPVADAPLAATGRSISGTEGASFSGVVASFTDANPGAAAGEFTATIAWGDGATTAGTIAADGSGGFTVSGSHTYADAEPYPVGVTIHDAGGSTATAGGTATMADAPLQAALPAIHPVAGSLFSGVVATFTDANPLAPLNDYSVTITWGDGATTAGTITGGSGSFTVSGSHTYAASGSYSFKVVVNDVHGGNSATASATVSVTAPSTGPVLPGQAAKFPFWNDKGGQALLKSFNGGPASTALANWLATNFPNLFGKRAGANNLTGKTNAQLAAFYAHWFNAEHVHIETQVLSTALSIYATTLSLGGAAGERFGFDVTADGLGSATFNVGRFGASFGVPNGTTLTVYQLLKAADGQAVNGVVNGGNAALQKGTRAVFLALNQVGSWYSGSYGDWWTAAHRRKHR